LSQQGSARSQRGRQDVDIGRPQQPGSQEWRAGSDMAERVNQRGEAIGRRLRQVSTGTWLVLLVAGALLTALIVSLVSSGHKDTVTTRLTALPAGGDDTHLPVRYEIVKPSHTEVRCRVDAIGVEHDVVGSLVDVTPAWSTGKRSAVRDVTVPTTKKAVSADITDCTIVNPH